MYTYMSIRHCIFLFCSGCFSSNPYKHRLLGVKYKDILETEQQLVHQSANYIHVDVMCSLSLLAHNLLYHITM